MSRRNISLPDAAMALELAESGMARKRVAEITGMGEITVMDIQKRKGHWLQDVAKPVFEEWRLRTKREIMGRSTELVVKLLKHADENLDKTSPYQAIGMYGILRTHDRLDAGEATQNISVHSEAPGLEQAATVIAEALMRFQTPVLESEKPTIDVEYSALESEAEEKNSEVK